MLALFLATIENNDQKARFEDIYYTYKSYMLKIIFFILKNERDSEEALSDAFFIICKNIDKLAEKDDRDLKPIICKIAKSAAINRYNKNKKARDTEIGSLENFDEADDNAGLEELDTYERLVLKISSLPPIYKDTLYLYYVSNFTVREISSFLGQNNNTVKSRLRRGTELLRVYLEECGYND